MANEVVQYPSYSQKAAYPVSHKPVAAETAIEPKPAPALQEQAPKFFPLVPVSSETVVDADAETDASVQTEVEPPEVGVAEATVLPETPVEQESIAVVEETAVEQDPAPELSPFQISGSLVLEPQTNSIVITQVPDALLGGSIMTETGEILTTGAIEIIAPPATGEIEIIPDSPDADSADAIDSATEYVSSVAPIRSSGVMNSKAKIGVLPGKLRKSMEHVVLATTLAVSIITVSSLLALAYMFGILR
jgi:hypothetical protein